MRPIIEICISTGRAGNVLCIVGSKPWVSTIQRLLKAEMRPSPRLKPGSKPHLKYWNGQDLAAASGVRANTVSDAMTGKRDPSLDTLAAIAKALGVPAALLLMEPDEADAYLRFRQSQTSSQEQQRLSELVRDMVQQAVAPVAAQIEQSVLQKLPTAQPTAPQELDPPAEVARGRLQRGKKKRSA